MFAAAKGREAAATSGRTATKGRWCRQPGNLAHGMKQETRWKMQNGGSLESLSKNRLGFSGHHSGSEDVSKMDGCYQAQVFYQQKQTAVRSEMRGETAVTLGLISSSMTSVQRG
jgi:hypothetical protein